MPLLRWALACLLLAAACAAPSAAQPLGLPPLPAAAVADLAADAKAQARVVLGRTLFFDRRLSVNGTLSCAMCHVPEQAFTVNELRTSVGMEGVSLRRNAPSLLNVAYQQRLFVDGRAGSLDEQALMPLLHPDELAQPSQRALMARIGQLPDYSATWRSAFGPGQPQAWQLARALAAYQRSLLAGDSAFDRWRAGDSAHSFSPQAQHGFALFQQRGCARCHSFGPRDALFTDGAFYNVGVAWRSRSGAQAARTVQLVPGLHAVVTPADMLRIGVPDQADEGRFEFSGRAADRRAFRTPSLRNVALTGPYMHDGSLATLDEVLNHYVAGGSPLDPAQDPRIRPLLLSAEERQALLAFLHALTSPSVAGCAAGNGDCRSRRDAARVLRTP